MAEYEVGVPYSTEVEYERKFSIDPTKLPPLRLPWIIVQAYPKSPAGMEESLRYIPARNRAYQRVKSISYDGIRQKASREVSTDQAQAALSTAPVALKERYLHSDETGRQWLIDHFPEEDRWQAETEYADEEDFNAGPWLDPEWVTGDITAQQAAYTRNHAKARTPQEVEQMVYEAGQGSAAPYTPSETIQTPDFVAQIQDQLNQVREARSELMQRRYSSQGRGNDYQRPDPVESIRLDEADDALSKEENRLMQELGDYMWLIPPAFEPPHNSSQVSPEKAKTILRDGTVRGHALSDAQRKFFGWVAGGRK